MTDTERLSRSEVADKLHGMGDTAYCRASDLSKRDLCLGEEHKIKTGSFTIENLKALEEVRAEFGRAAGLWEAAKMLRALPSEQTRKDGRMTPKQLDALRMLNDAFESHDGRPVDQAIITKADGRLLYEALAEGTLGDRIAASLLGVRT